MNPPATTGPAADLPPRSATRGPLLESAMPADPLVQFDAWFRDAIASGMTDPNAMSLATAGADGRPLVRSVLLKNHDARGFVFYTNLSSRKARQLAENPHAALLFPWLVLERQVIITGPVERLPLAEAIRYFVTRPRDSQIGAWASHQSSPLSSRQLLEMEWAALKRKFAGGDVPMPDFWGGFRVVPETIEFWQGGAARLHDRLQYTRAASGMGWTLGRLAP